MVQNGHNKTKLEVQAYRFIALLFSALTNNLLLHLMCTGKQLIAN